MVQMSSEIKRALLRMLYRSGKNAKVPLKDTLEAYQDASGSAIKSGRVVINSSGGGYSTGLEITQQWRQLTPEKVTELSELFINMRDDAVATLALNGNNLPSDDDVFGVMIQDDRVNGVRQAMGDFTGLRFPSLR